MWICFVFAIQIHALLLLVEISTNDVLRARIFSVVVKSIVA